jgi:hypothetical protein
MERSFAIVCLLLASCASAATLPTNSADKDLWVPGFPSLPRDARRVVERLAGCSHFAGEFNGDRSQRDKDVSAAEAKLRCETIEQDATAIRTKYAGNKSVQDALVAASEL